MYSRERKDCLRHSLKAFAMSTFRQHNLSSDNEEIHDHVVCTAASKPPLIPTPVLDHKVKICLQDVV